MAIRLRNDTLEAGHKRVSLTSVPELVAAHLQLVCGTRELESIGVELEKRGFPRQSIAPFVREVCRWGGYAGIAGRILNQNAIVSIQSQFLTASLALKLKTPVAQRLASALRAVNEVRQLGAPSFASKHLRFMGPRLCPILDSQVATKCRYPCNLGGFVRYSEDCLAVARRLETLRVRNPMNRSGHRWFAADIDMAVFMLI